MGVWRILVGFLQMWWGSSKADGVGELWVGLTKKSMGLTYNEDVTKGSYCKGFH